MDGWEELSFDAVDNLLNSNLLKRDRTPREPGKLSAAKEYVLVLCG